MRGLRGARFPDSGMARLASCLRSARCPQGHAAYRLLPAGAGASIRRTQVHAVHAMTMRYIGAACSLQTKRSPMETMGMNSEPPWADHVQQFQQILRQSWSQALQSLPALGLGAQFRAAEPIQFSQTKL